jgi:hypothetical protein
MMSPNLPTQGGQFNQPWQSKPIVPSKNNWYSMFVVMYFIHPLQRTSNAIIMINIIVLADWFAFSSQLSPSANSQFACLLIPVSLSANQFFPFVVPLSNSLLFQFFCANSDFIWSILHFSVPILSFFLPSFAFVTVLCFANFHMSFEFVQHSFPSLSLPSFVLLFIRFFFSVTYFVVSAFHWTPTFPFWASFRRNLTVIRFHFLFL